LKKRLLGRGNKTYGDLKEQACIIYGNPTVARKVRTGNFGGAGALEANSYPEGDYDVADVNFAVAVEVSAERFGPRGDGDQQT
jgi:hypothetical protein